MSDTEAGPLTEAELERDSHDCFYEYLKIVREEMRAGKPLPRMFRSVKEAPDAR